MATQAGSGKVGNSGSGNSGNWGRGSSSSGTGGNSCFGKVGMVGGGCYSGFGSRGDFGTSKRWREAITLLPLKHGGATMNTGNITDDWWWLGYLTTQNW